VDVSVFSVSVSVDLDRRLYPTKCLLFLTSEFLWFLERDSFAIQPKLATNINKTTIKCLKVYYKDILGRLLTLYDIN
jgi:hypothetical protein